MAAASLWQRDTWVIFIYLLFDPFFRLGLQFGRLENNPPAELPSFVHDVKGGVRQVRSVNPGVTIPVKKSFNFPRFLQGCLISAKRAFAPPVVVGKESVTADEDFCAIAAPGFLLNGAAEFDVIV